MSTNQATSLKIVISNDDGLSSNVVALHKALKTAGHDVIISVPCHNQSGVGGGLWQGAPEITLSSPCRCGAAPTGAPAAGQMVRQGLDNSDFFYMNGTPLMSLLYGVDVVAQKRWGRNPDLVLSGPNEGQNVGGILASSGTLGAVQGGLMRNIPSIAFSGDANTADDVNLANPLSLPIAERCVELVQHLIKSKSGDKLLPAGIALNVNFPTDAKNAQWRAARIGTYNAYDFRCVEDMAASASDQELKIAKEHNMQIAHAPGLVIKMNDTPPTEAQMDDESIVCRTAISVSVIKLGYGADSLELIADWVVGGMQNSA